MKQIAVPIWAVHQLQPFGSANPLSGEILQRFRPPEILPQGAEQADFTRRILILPPAIQHVR